MKVNKILSGIIPAAMIGTLALTACSPSVDAYTATFDYNYDGAPAAYTQEVQAGELVTPPDDPARENYEFKGWYNEESCKTKADFDYTVTGDCFYYALWQQTVATVTYYPNYEGAAGTKTSVAVGERATQPEEPVREGYVFVGWYTDEGCNNEFSFETEIAFDIELYADWEEATGDTIKVCFENNYEGGGIYYSQTINTGRRIAKPAEPTREGYAFIGWYSDAACTENFNFNAFLNENTNIYAKWNKIHTFEAEYTDLTGMAGVGWSSSVEGLGLIDRDNMNGGASNGFFVGYMYVTGNTLTFNVTAAEATDDCIIALRLTAEGEEGSVVSLSDEELLVRVNGQKISYAGLYFDDIPDINGGTRRPFSTHVIASVSLQKGNNVITLVVNNEKSMGGTMTATAPMFDCLYLYTNTDVDWTEGECHEDNLYGLRD